MRIQATSTSNGSGRINHQVVLKPEHTAIAASSTEGILRWPRAPFHPLTGKESGKSASQLPHKSYLHLSVRVIMSARRRYIGSRESQTQEKIVLAGYSTL